VVERDEVIDDGLPRDKLSQDDQIMVSIGQMGLDPLSREGILKGVCYHDRDLFAGLRNVEMSLA
jgi:hypothetical protein